MDLAAIPAIHQFLVILQFVLFAVLRVVAYSFEYIPADEATSALRNPAIRDSVAIPQGPITIPWPPAAILVILMRRLQT